MTERNSTSLYVDGSEIYAKMGFYQDDMSIVLDDKTRVGKLLDYARDFSEAYKSRDASQLQRFITKEEADLILSSNQPDVEYERFASKYFQREIVDKFGMPPRERESKERSMDDIARDFQILLIEDWIIPSTKEQGLERSGKMETLAQEYNSKVEEVNKNTDQDDYEKISDYGKMPWKDKPVCRHYSPLMSVMLTEAGIDNAVFTNRVLTKEDNEFGGHMAVISKNTGNVFEPSDFRTEGHYQICMVRSGKLETGDATLLTADVNGRVSIYTSDEAYSNITSVIPAKFVMFQLEEDLKSGDWNKARENAVENLDKMGVEIRNPNTLEVPAIREAARAELVGYLIPPEVFENAPKAQVVSER